MRFSVLRTRCTAGVAKMKKFWNSRKWRSPITESISAAGRKTPARGERPGFSGEGENSEVERICERRSGEALTRNQRFGREEKAIWVCERGRERSESVRRPEQLRQAQFHWGNPPSAAEPRILMCIQRAFWLDRASVMHARWIRQVGAQTDREDCVYLAPVPERGAPYIQANSVERLHRMLSG